MERLEWMRAARSAGRRGRVRLTLGAVLAAGALVLTACGGGGSSSDDDGPKATELTVGITSPISALDPAKDANGVHHFFRYLAYEPIIAADPATGEYKPALAEEFGYVGEGNTAYEFTLREGATFSDGTPLDAAAIKAWFEYFSETSTSFGKQMPLKEIVTEGDRTVRLELTAPTPTVELYMSSSNWAYVSQVDPARLDKEMLGNGPYVFDSAASVDGDSYVFTPTPDYYDPSVQHYKKVTVKVIDNPNSMLAAVRSGEIDVALGSPSTVDAAASAEGVDVFHNDGGWAGFEFMDLSGKAVKPLGDVRVRQALNYAVDRKTITTALMGEYGRPTSAWLPLDVQNVYDETNDYYDYDPAKAKALLEEAGYGDGFTLPVLVQGWQSNSGTPLVQAVAANLQEIGVELEMTEAPTSGEYYSKVLAGEGPFVHLSQMSAPAYATSVNRWTSAASLNFFDNDITEPEKLIRTLAEAPKEEAETASNDVTQYITENAFQIPVFTTPLFVYANADKVAGLSNDNVTKYLGWSPSILQIEPR